MTIYIALLRGINVGGHHKIKMAELKSLLESMGLQKVKTYIQSGNVLFESEETAESLTLRLEEAIKEKFGFPVPVVLRSSEEYEKVITDCPYRMDGLQEGESIQIAFLAGLPSQEGIERVSAYRSEMEDFQIIGKDVYLFFRQSIRDSKIAQHLSKIGAPATIRNWNTVMKLDSMAKELKEHP
ncbi:DUF1697 domain-containing protein [Neobacillus massiliamazoniensis]|jgi:uncharacterized protein (DUF1697 family)|uniref:Cytoplasmic protein n=1 Tax=Neobacillus massiliamazoniensis TaxID=1499688 RepID=A0A0U1NWG7_9BACI|nr:DUF1697 domain-containing protein [Neobacillus massiliamazoniensis]CRK82367.1 cytoplasmic protein [Neobacillus massiliamazoniensis]